MSDEPPATAAIVGRDAELAALAALLDGAREGRGDVLVLCGDAGVGRSALLRAACRAAAASDMVVLDGRGVAAEARLAFGALHQLLLAVLHELPALAPAQARALRGALGLGAGDAGEAPRLLVAVAVLELLRRAAGDGGLLCVVDDAQWLDDASREVLLFVARRLTGGPVAMLLAARVDEAARFAPADLPALEVGPLEPQAAGALLDQHADRPLSPDVRRELVAAARGNPLALVELSAALTDAQRRGEAAILAPLPISARVEQTFLARVCRLPAETQALLLIAAADDGGELAVVLDAGGRLGIPGSALDHAERGGLVDVRDGRLEFRHPLVRFAAYHGAPSSQRRAAHRALAEALPGDARADRRAWHRAEAGVAPDPSVVADLEHAAERARERGSFPAASLAMERAAALALDEDEQGRLLAAAGHHAWAGGRIERAVALLERARRLTADPLARADVDRTLGLIELASGVPGEACQVLLRAGAEVGARDAARALELLMLACLAAVYVCDRDAIAAVARHAREMPAPDAPLPRFCWEYVRGVGAHYDRDFAAAAAHLGAALELTDAADAQAAASPTLQELLLFASAAAMLLGADRRCRDLHRRAVARARDNGVASVQTHTLARLALSEIWAGEWMAAAVTLGEATDLARATSQHHVAAFVLAESAVVAGLRGDEDACRALAARSARLSSSRGLWHVMYTANWGLMSLELALGRAEEAFRHAQSATVHSGFFWDALDRIEAAVRAGEPAYAAAALDALDRWAGATGSAWGRAVVHHGRALLADDPAEAERRFAAALDEHEHTARPFERARTQLALGEQLRRARRRREARRHLRAALEGFEALGARLWVERARVELRASGQTARRREASTIDLLTPQELQIARCVAEGRTNREVAAQLFLSPRTIDFHLRNVFRKLEISSRTELARLPLGDEAADDGAERRAASPV